ncbi:MAG: FHA domain-containing protein [Candidatus Cloacimonetes bacterium]|nr:FHA domain-containing protein [Candidatus Cloacimonadota bacterium]
MSYKCDVCGQELFSKWLFCSFCGENVSGRTVVLTTEKEDIENPKYCPECNTTNHFESLYCNQCGFDLHKRPDKEFLFCGKCRTKNRQNALICIKCGLSLEDWFSMKGEIAISLGYKGDLVLTEKMTGISFHFLSSEELIIGRLKTNYVCIPCTFVSGKHCGFDMKNKFLRDYASTNGTFINRSSERFKKIPLDLVSEFNIADAFTFYTVKKKNLFGFRLGAIYNEENCRRNGDGESFDKLRKQYYLLSTGDYEIRIQKLDAFITDKIKPGVSYYSIKFENGFYYYSDKDKGINNRLLIKRFNNLPKNWALEGIFNED